MKKITLFSLSVLLVLGALTFGFGTEEAAQATTQLPAQAETKDESLAAFTTMMKVLTHKRCVNCHPAGDRPRQGEDSHIHNFNVLRGEDDHGIAALRCETCHQKENNMYSGVPGAPEWALAPREMVWEGLTRVEIARSMMNPKINGGRDLTATVKHLTEHELVLWAWEPGVNADGEEREKPPVGKEEYIAAVKKWAETGAFIPEK